MARRYHVAPLPEPGDVRLPHDVGHHLARVMRARAGDPIVLFDGAGLECRGEILTIGGSGHRPLVTVAVRESYAATREPRPRVEVAFAAPKGRRAEWLFEHGTEVGIAAFRPLHTGRSCAADRTERWLRIVTAATGQCDRGRIPQIHRSTRLAEFLTDPDLPAERYVADADGPPMGRAEADAALLLVGPEGGLSATELDLAAGHGFARRSLGVTTLRTETAVIAGAVLLLQGRGSGMG